MITTIDRNRSAFVLKPIYSSRNFYACKISIGTYLLALVCILYKTRSTLLVLPFTWSAQKQKLNETYSTYSKHYGYTGNRDMLEQPKINSNECKLKQQKFDRSVYFPQWYSWKRRRALIAPPHRLVPPLHRCHLHPPHLRLPTPHIPWMQ